MATRVAAPSSFCALTGRSLSEDGASARQHRQCRWLELIGSLTAVDEGPASTGPRRPAPSLLADDAARLVERALGDRSASHSGTDLRIFLAGAREPGLRDLAAQALTAFEELLAGLLTRSGVPDPGEVAGTLVTLLLGTAVRRQAAGDPEADRREITRLAAQVRRLVAESAPR